MVTVSLDAWRRSLLSSRHWDLPRHWPVPSYNVLCHDMATCPVISLTCPMSCHLHVLCHAPNMYYVLTHHQYFPSCRAQNVLRITDAQTGLRYYQPSSPFIWYFTFLADIFCVEHNQSASTARMSYHNNSGSDLAPISVSACECWVFI